MQRRKITGATIIAGLALTAVSAIALIGARPVVAQCGSQASSCKNCHETQAQDPVNADGTGWHESHAFGDFCYICHGGNNQAAEADAAHAGMLAPMSDVQTACAQCHPNDLQARSDVYTAALGIPAVILGQSASAVPAASSTETAEPQPVEDSPALSVAASIELPPNDPNLVDYVARYNEEVLNQEPMNRGNIILTVVLVGLLAAGLIFINRREGWISITFSEKKAIEKEYAADVLEIADQVSNLDGNGRRALGRLLKRPAASDVLTALDRLSSDKSSGDK